MSNLLKQRGIRESEGRRYAASRRSKGRLEDLLCRVWWFLLTSECEYDNYYFCNDSGSFFIILLHVKFSNQRGKFTTDVFLYDKNGVEIICFVLIDGRQTKERMLEEKKFLLPMAFYKVP